MYNKVHPYSHYTHIEISLSLNVVEEKRPFNPVLYLQNDDPDSELHELQDMQTGHAAWYNYDENQEANSSSNVSRHLSCSEDLKPKANNITLMIPFMWRIILLWGTRTEQMHHAIFLGCKISQTLTGYFMVKSCCIKNEGPHIYHVDDTSLKRISHSLGCTIRMIMNCYIMFIKVG